MDNALEQGELLAVHRTYGGKEIGYLVNWEENDLGYGTGVKYYIRKDFMNIVVEGKIKKFEAVKHTRASVTGYRLRGINTNISYVRDMSYDEIEEYVNIAE